MATMIVRGMPVDVAAQPGEELVTVFRRLVPEHREALLAVEDELRRRVPADLPEILRLEEWSQPDLFVTRPSESETYRQLADVVAAADPSRYSPTEAPNTHWSNWPASGSL